MTFSKIIDIISGINGYNNIFKNTYPILDNKSKLIYIRFNFKYLKRRESSCATKKKTPVKTA